MEKYEWEDTLNELEKNMLFQVSLGSKELFHSNFLAWLFELDPIFSQRIFERLFGIKENFDHIKVTREKNNIDLFISLWKNGKIIKRIAIENKIKSLPTKAQLELYSEKIKKSKEIEADKTSSILLSIKKPNSDCLPEPWKSANYLDLADALEDNKFISSIDTKYFQFKDIIEAYVSFIRSLSEIEELVSINEQYDLYSEDNKFIQKCRKLRIHDFIIKSMHNDMVIEIDKKLQEKNIFCKSTDKDLKNIGDYYLSAGFTRSTGITDFKCLFYKNNGFRYVLGVQLQKNQLKYVCESNDKKNNIKIAEALRKEGTWMKYLEILNDFILLEDGKENTLGKGRNKAYDFCEYDEGRFLYKYSLLSDQNIKSNIVDAFVKLIEYLKNNQGKIQRIIKNQLHN